MLLVFFYLALFVILNKFANDYYNMFYNIFSIQKFKFTLKIKILTCILYCSFIPAWIFFIRGNQYFLLKYNDLRFCNFFISIFTGYVVENGMILQGNSI